MNVGTSMSFVPNSSEIGQRSRSSKVAVKPVSYRCLRYRRESAVVQNAPDEGTASSAFEPRRNALACAATPDAGPVVKQG